MQNNNIPHMIVQYTFSDGIEMPIKVAPHGNSTKSKQPFLHTQCSTLESIKENVPVMLSKKVLKETFQSRWIVANVQYWATPAVQGSRKYLSIQFCNAKVDHVSLERVKTM